MAYGPWGNEANASTRFTGTWITDPDDPAGTAIRLRYGGLGRQNAKDRAKTAMQFVGRKYPIYDTGDARAESVSVDTTLIAEDAEAEAQLELLSTMISEGDVVLYRDGRGRKIYAVGTDFQVEDTDMGSYHVTFLLNRVDYDEALPEPDATSPSTPDTQPQNLQVTVDNYSGMALINWDPVTDQQIYHIQLNGVEVGSTSENATTYGPLSSGDYVMTVTAVVAGIESAPSVPVSFNVTRPTAPPSGGGTGTPSTTVPQNFRAFPTAQKSVTMQADPVSGATQYQLFEARSPNGVTNGISTTPNWTRGVPTPLGDGPFDYWCKALVNGVWSAESNHQQFTLPYDGGVVSGGSGGTGAVAAVVRSVSTGKKASNSDTSITVPKPAGLVANDYLLAFSMGDADVSDTSQTSTGFGSLGSQPGGGSDNYPSLKILGKVASSGDAGATNFTFASAGTGDGAVILVAITTGTYNTTTPVSVGGFTTQPRTSAMTQTAAGITGVAQQLLFAVFATDTNNVTESYPAAGPSGFTQTATVQGTPHYALLGAYHKSLTAGGSTGSISVSPTPTSSTNGWTAVQVAVNGLPATGGGGGGGTGGAMPSPVEVLGIKNGDAGYLHYNLGVGFTDSKGMKDYYLQDLEDWTSGTAAELANNYYTVIDAAGKYAVAMTVDPNAATTNGSSYPRAEHREMAQTDSGNANKGAWDPTSGDNDFAGFSRIMTLPPAKPGVAINQCHDAQDDTVMIKTMPLSGKIAMVLDVFGTRVAVLQADYKLGIEVWTRIRLNAGTLTVYYKESTSTTTSATTTATVAYTQSGITNTNPPWYHKFGCYAQSNATTDSSGIKCLVYVRDWTQWHTGWPTPVTGNYAGPGGTGGTGSPLVSAGADATVTPGATFSRTAQVTGSGITSQGWRIVGSGGATTDQSTAAGKNSWGVPDAMSDEFNYTGAPDANKWSVYNGVGHGGNGVRSPSRIAVANGVCTLTGLVGSPNTGGMAHKLNRQYGKTEIRARSYYTADPNAPGDKTGGYHPVAILWTDSVSYPYGGEYDFMENGEPGEQSADAFLHYPSLNGTNYQIDVPNTPVDLRQFHNFAIEWTSSSIKLYVDGVLWYTASGGAVAGQRKNIQDMDSGSHLTLQLDALQATGLIGSAMEVEWVRFYPVTPVTSGAQISSSASVNYVAPSTPGTYTLEFFATNASGTSTDQMVLTVGQPSGGGETGGTSGGGGGGTTVGQTLGIGGTPTPAPASNVVLIGSDSTSQLKITTGGKIYDGGGHKVPSIMITADNVTVQNFDVGGGTAPGIYSMGTGNTIQNNRITQMGPPSDSDINGITWFGDNSKILYNEIGTDASTLVKGDPGGSHTDGMQTWDTSSKRSSSNVLIKGNRIVGPGASDAKRLHQCIMAEGPDSTDGGGGGPGISQNWTVEDNYFKAYGGAQTLKFDDIHDVTIRRNTFAGSTTKCVATGSLSTGINFVTSGADANIITGSYSSMVGG